MVKKSILGLIVFLLIVQFVIAVDTELTVKTVPEKRVDISVVRPNQVYSLIKSFHVNSDSNGDAKVTFSHDEETFNVRVWVKGDGVEIANKKFEEEYPTGESLILQLYPKWYSPPINETVLNETNSSAETNLTNVEENASDAFIPVEPNVENSQVNSSGTGAVILNNNFGYSSKVFYYAVGAVFLIIIFLFLGNFFLRKEKVNKEIKVKKLSEFNAERKEQLESGNYKGVIENAERKIEEAQKEINRLKNEGKIKEIRERIERDQQELNKLIV